MATGGMKRRVAQGLAVLLSISTLATLLMLGVSLARNPFAAPWVERETEALSLRIDRMIAAEVDRDWVDARLEAALAEEPRDWSRIDLIQEIARNEKVSPDPALAARVDSARGSDTEMLRRTERCLRCALDVADCPDPDTLAACNLPLELTPVGDANALRRNFQAWTTGDPTDNLEVGLAVVGLGATAAAVFTGGGSLPVKAGTSALRVARRTGNLTKSFQAALLEQVRALDFQWEKVPAWLVRGNGIDALVRNHEALSRLGNNGGRSRPHPSRNGIVCRDDRPPAPYRQSGRSGLVGASRGSRRTTCACGHRGPWQIPRIARYTPSGRRRCLDHQADRRGRRADGTCGPRSAESGPALRDTGSCRPRQPIASKGK